MDIINISGEPKAKMIGSGHRDEEGEDESSEDRTQHGRHLGTAQRSTGLALLGHGITVQHGGRADRFSRYPEKDRSDTASLRACGGDDKQKGEREGGVQTINNGKQDGQCGCDAQSGQDAHQQTDDHPEKYPGQHARV